MSAPNSDTHCRVATHRGAARTTPSADRWSARAVTRCRTAARSPYFFPILLAAIAVALYVPRLTTPDRYLYDEILFAYTAGEYAEGNADAWRWDHPCSVMQSAERCAELYPDHVLAPTRLGRFQWAHPPLAKLVMGAGILLFGNDVLGWRIMSVLTGTVGVVMAYYLGLTLTGRRAVGALAGGLLLADGLYFIYSRTGLLDIFLTVFASSMLLAFTWYLRSPPERTSVPLLVTGVMIGLSIATKWSAAYGAFFVGLAIVVRFVHIWRASRAPGSSSALRLAARQHLVLGPIALVLIPATLYMLSYLPYFLSGGYGIDEFIELQRQMLHLQTTLRDDPTSASRWWTWPLDLRSVWFGRRTFEDGRTAATNAFGNPLLYWAFVPAVGWTLVRWWRSRVSVAWVVLLIGFVGQWLPWALVDRSTYLYHFLPAVPFGCLAVAASVVHITSTWRDWRRTLAIEYIVLVALAFIFFYPIVAFYPLTEHWYRLRFWLSSWT